MFVLWYVMSRYALYIYVCGWVLSTDNALSSSYKKLASRLAEWAYVEDRTQVDTRFCTTFVLFSLYLSSFHSFCTRIVFFSCLAASGGGDVLPENVMKAGCNYNNHHYVLIHYICMLLVILLSQCEIHFLYFCRYIYYGCGY